ncbi:N-formylglutamate amidohydrolase [Acidisphaera sp. L21]|uniref:N-formylglutamate amidohydrolase n=1 Tax=Acidisphaera sp. L21 TaxID=1641851 RepID=UPI00131D5BB4|nr:N-formylglutamate amidohydrolase [Acidisphaera sp. L21]
MLDSPHSGNTWPEDWHPIAPREALDTAWDAYVAELFAGAPAHGATLLEAHFPRTFIDVNRSRLDIDPAMLDGEWPTELVPTPKSIRGLGLLRRLALPDVPVYGAPLPVARVQAWIAAYYDTYHAALAAELEAMHAKFDQVWHVDCLSMKSAGNVMNTDAGKKRPDFVVSDRDGTTADPQTTRFVVETLTQLGFEVTVNTPYKGAELITRHSDPAGGQQSVQIMINRALYLNEATREKGADFTAIQTALDTFVARFAGFIRSTVRPV